MKKIYTTLLLLVVTALSASAQLESYIPNEWTYNATTGIYTKSSTDQYYKHELSSEHFDVYYQVGWGSTPPEKLSSSNTYYVNVPDLLEKAEMFFDVNVNKLKFADLENSKLSKYKMIICLLYDSGWTCTGSGYDNTIGALWVTPSTCHPVGQSIGHEIGHAFQYQCYSDLGGYAGFRYANGSGSSFWEQTAQWQSVVAYPSAMMSQSMDLFPKTYNYAFTHEWHRYQSYWLHYYWAEKRGIDAVGRVWRGGTVNGEDPNQVYMRVFDVSVNDYYKEIYEYAAKMATFDFDIENVKSAAKSYIGTFKFNSVDTIIDGESEIQVAYSSCPQATGFNIIPLQVPEAGTEIKACFTAMPPASKLNSKDPKQYIDGDSKYVTVSQTTYNTFTNKAKRGFRHGYVALLKDGTRVYQSIDTVYAKGTASRRDTTSFVVPKNTERLFFVVSPAPTAHFVHNWDSKIENDDQWPYRVKFINTDMVGHLPTVDLSDSTIAPKDTLIEINVGFDASSDSYDGTTINLTTPQIKAIAEALRLQPSEISSKMKTYSSSQSVGTVMFFPLNPTTLKPVGNKSTTSATYGHWFSNTGTVCEWANTNSSVYSDFTPSTFAFTIGQYKGKLKNGEVYTIGQALRLKVATNQYAIAKILFHVYIGGVPEPEEPEIAEDVNADDAVDTQDVLKIYEYMKSHTEGSSEGTPEDVNGDGAVDTQDVLKVYEYMKSN